MGGANLTGAGNASERDASGRDASERRPGFRAAGAALARVVAPIVARHDGIAARLKAEWPTIVGAELAAVTWPDSLSRDGTLRLRVNPANALQVQHRAPLVIDRVNLFFGRAAVTRLALVQATLPLPAPPRRQQARPPTPDEAAAVDRQVAAVGSPELREALARLGRSVIGAAAPRG